MRTPLACIALPLAVGIGLADVLGSGAPIAAIVLWAMATGMFWMRWRGAAGFLLVTSMMPASFGTGLVVQWAQRDLASRATRQMESMGSGLWMGTVCGGVRTSADGAIRSFRFCPDDAGGRGLLVRFPFAGPTPEWMAHEGDHLRMVARVRSARAKRNPYDFDEKEWLASRRIAGVAEPDSIVVGHPAPDTGRWIHWIRNTLSERMERTFPTRTSADLYRAMILGERSALPEELNEAFRRSGLSHLLAISGLHVAVLATAVYFLVGWPLRVLKITGRSRFVLRSAMIILLLIFYGLVVGWSASVQRAVVMSSLVATAQASGRRNVTWNALFAAAILILIWAPDQLHQPGFQLSFSAVSGILWFAGSAPEGSGRIHTSVRSSIVVSLAAGAATLPALLYHFGRVSLASLLFSPFAVAALSVGLPLAWLAVLLPSYLSEPIAQVAALLAHVQVGLAGTGSDSAWIPVWRVDPGTLSIVFLLPVLVLAAWVLPPGKYRNWTFCHVVALFLWVMWKPVFLNPPALDVAVLDVGQGDGIVVRAPSGNILVMDTGPGPRSARTLITHIKRWSEKPPSIILLSHDHVDHTGGLLYLQQEWPSVQPTMRRYSGESIELDPHVRIRVLHPPGDSPLEENNRSLLVQIVYGETSLLLTGDIESEAEKEVTLRYGDMLGSGVVKVPHHGSRSSSSPAFVAAVSAEWALISAGSSNRFGHPHMDVVSRWEFSGARTWVTGQEGGIWIRSNGKRISVNYPSQ